MNTLKRRNVNTLSHLITDGLGYCCEAYFFSHFSNTALIAARLGVTTRAVRYHKAAGKTCLNAVNCMKERKLKC